MSSILFLNTVNGYSGLATVDYFYYALFGVINTTIFPIIIYVATTYVDYNFEHYGKEV
jgi:hypothetical protein